MTPISLPSRFYSVRSSSIKYIVLHTTEGTDSRTWLTQTGNVSANYLVRRKDVYQLVGEDFAAWHAGRIVGVPTTPLYTGVNPNDESIGIEMEGHAAQLLDVDTLAATAELIRDIRSRRGPLPLVNHAELSPGDRTDPGAANRAALDALLEEDMDITELRRVIQEEIAAYGARLQPELEVDRKRIDDLLTRVNTISAANEHQHEGATTVIFNTGGPITR